MRGNIKSLIAGLLGIILTVNCTVNVQAEESREQILQREYNKKIETNEINGWPKGPKVYGESAIVMDMDTGAVLYGKGIDKKQYPASITKILTALVAVENSSMTDMVKFSWESVHCLEPGYAHIAMQPEEEITMKDALHALMLASANEVAYAIGETVGGTHENFIKMMNDKAAELGCKNTHFINTNGMFDEEHYTSARDMALISRAAFSHQELLDVVQTLQYTIQPTNKVNEPRVFQQKHKMLQQGEFYDERCIGGKTGYTEKAHNTLVTVMKKGEQEVVAVIMNSRKDTFQDTKKICDYALGNFENVNIALNEKSKDFDQIDQDACVTLPKNAAFEDLQCTADQTGNLSYTYCGQNVGSAKAELKKEMKVVKNETAKEKSLFSKSLVIKIVVIAVSILAAVGLLTAWLEMRRRAKMRRERRRRRMMKRRSRDYR